MKNVRVLAIKDNKATIEVDLSKSFGPSKSGKTEMIATTNGNQPLHGDIKFGLNVYRVKSE